MRIRATNIETGEIFEFEKSESNLHLFHLGFSSKVWLLEFVN
jgi:hypothetical protein